MSEDPQTAQARMFLADLEQYAQRLVRRRGQWGAEQPHQGVEAELAQVRRQIANLHQRFPGLRSTPG
ncbi:MULTISPECIES: hypothetical protein [Nocardia]|uniref:hypothetical protein n=1 Tax=Nocardia TaxID=1817 RepID=UPI0007E9EF71|nr:MULTISPECIES: hypothetical protein [Nocardia]MBF6278432.1 hypothetical protein [Nocardia nova]OBA50513.1 hypothetical protein A5789_29110 [Nocardia sp. 852002-51101_SCH5132738]OBB45407.1 hypothetical protein A5748_26080 [Nocardia sp. 852002-51244_SCH5132740]